MKLIQPLQFLGFPYVQILEITKTNVIYIGKYGLVLPVSTCYLYDIYDGVCEKGMQYNLCTNQSYTQAESKQKQWQDACRNRTHIAVAYGAADVNS